ncbi:MAG: hypothetical protein N4A33_00465 [Bacteriovoracaceae bacterium]|jgi:hypothetical protein|nr:hypothetical protein [Bacteriovoracaceae bacterium]
MKLVISLLIISFSSFSCHLDKSYEYISLSSPMSFLLDELGLLDKVKYVSSFYPKKTAVKKISGGIFLKPSELSIKKNTIIFLDRSKDLSRIFKEYQNTYFLDLKSMSAQKATYKTLAAVKKYTRNCDKKISLIEEKIKKVTRKISRKKFHSKYLFFLATFAKNLRNESMLITEDIFVKDLKQNKSFKTYPSSLAYTRYSQKVLEINKGIYIGLDSQVEIPKVTKIKSDVYNIYFPGSLTPGISQINFLDYFLDISF